MVRRQLENAELDEAGLLKLVAQEVSDGFVLKFDGTMEDALLTWPSGVAKGNLSVARSLGKADRLVLDTTINNVNPLAHIPEKTSVLGPMTLTTTFIWIPICHAWP